jgi:hypothetical protein
MAFVPECGRGKHPNNMCISEEEKQVIRDHINTFPALKAYYSRSHTNKKYNLYPNLSISKTYRPYNQHCTKENVVPKSKAFYTKIVVQFSLTFKKPK